MTDVKTNIQNTREDIKRNVKNSTTENPLKKLKNNLEAEGHKGGNVVRNMLENLNDEDNYKDL